MQSPHDTTFQFTFRHAFHAAAWLRSVVTPGLRDAIDWSGLAPVRERFPGVRVRPHFADTAFATKLSAEGIDHDLVLLVEHKSWLDPDLEAQLLRYSIHLQRALQQCRARRPLVLPIVLRHGTDAAVPRAAHPVGPVLAEVLAAQPRQQILVDDLDATTETDLAARGLTPLGELTMLCLRTLPGAAADDVPLAFDRWQHLLRAVDRVDAPPHAPPLGADAVDAIGWYALAATEVGSLRLAETFARILSRPESTIMSTLERTFQKGIARGRDEGRVEVILRLLQRRFGPLDATTVNRLQTATAAELDRFADRLLEHTTLAAVLAD